MASNTKTTLELHRLDPALADYEKALKMLVSREERLAAKRSARPFGGFFRRTGAPRNVDSLMREWRSREPLLPKVPTPRIKREPVIVEGPRNVPGPNRLQVFNPHYAPVFFATLLILASFTVLLRTPGTYVSGYFNQVHLDFPKTSEVQSWILDYATPMSDDSLGQDLGDIDVKKFQALTTQDYVIQQGDTLSGIAHKYNLNMDTIISFNAITNPRAIRIGQTYKVPNRNGLLYKVAANDTLETVAKKFDTTVIAILDANDMVDEAVNIGQSIFVPDARMNPTDLKMLLGELFLWPTQGRFTSGYGYRRDPFTGQRRFHNGIDIANAIGTPVKAALAGTVVAVENQIGNYGKVIIIQHPRGFRTLYAHLSSFNIQMGQSVAAGQTIGRMGNTGRSTGTHLHFSVILNGAFVNPIRYLK